MVLQPTNQSTLVLIMHGMANSSAGPPLLEMKRWTAATQGIAKQSACRWKHPTLDGKHNVSERFSPQTAVRSSLQA